MDKKTARMLCTICDVLGTLQRHTGVEYLSKDVEKFRKECFATLRREEREQTLPEAGTPPVTQLINSAFLAKSKRGDVNLILVEQEREEVLRYIHDLEERCGELPSSEGQRLEDSTQGSQGGTVPIPPEPPNPYKEKDGLGAALPGMTIGDVLKHKADQQPNLVSYKSLWVVVEQVERLVEAAPTLCRTEEFALLRDSLRNSRQAAKRG